jgi:hypothetical protein
MKYNRFEDLPVWQDAIELAVRFMSSPREFNSDVDTVCAINLNEPLFLSQTTLQRVLNEAQRKIY